MNKPVAWTNKDELAKYRPIIAEKEYSIHFPIPLYTHPVKELTDELEKTNDGLWEELKKYIDSKPISLKELTDEEIEEFAYAFQLWQLHNPDKALEGIMDFARAILRKASE